MDTKDQEFIDRYIRQELSDEELSSFKKAIEEDKEIASNVELLENTRRRLGAHTMRDKLEKWGYTEDNKFQEINRKNRNTNLKIWGSVALAACIISFIIMGLPQLNSEIHQFENPKQQPSFESPLLTDSLESNSINTTSDSLQSYQIELIESK